MSEYAIQPLDAATWDAFVHLAEKHNGVWNGCWCTWFHPACAEKGESPKGNRGYKERLVREGKAHAALVFDGDVASNGVSTALRRSFRTFTTGRSTTQASTRRRITALLASSSTGTTGAKASQPWRFVVPWI
jgi:hypothetical protein